MEIKKNRVLVIAPHADDEVLGCGATIAKYSEDGNEVWVVIATNANKGDSNLFSKGDVECVRREALLAHDILGVKKTIFFDFPAPRLDAYPNYKISIELSKVFSEFRPDTIYLPHPGDLHLDHKSVYQAALVAARPQEGCSVRNIFCYETLSETEWSPIQGDTSFKPNYFINVSSVFDKKIEAMNCFVSQLKKFPNPRSILALTYLAGYRGSTIGVERAEAYEVERKILL